MPEDFAALPAEEIERRVESLKERMRPVQLDLDRLRAERDVLLTELRRRERLAAMNSRRDLKTAMRSGDLRTVADLVAGADSGSFDDYVFNLKTGGEVRLGFPGARSQTIAFTDGRQVAQAKDLAEAARFFGAGWELGAPGKPGVRVHFPGTRTERLVTPEEVFARPAGG
ncbi:MAG: hypothetical protein E6J29_13470 [Chloroflexi bacterium]|nr:MAG: hypothetical protein E6J29_13470 [Chloroflexota bacterium]TMD55392.1 MAG: hypothetical protein E6I85_03220 [Chloroflexota bacterium]